MTGFPATGRTVWNIANAVCKEMFELILADFVRSVGGNRQAHRTSAQQRQLARAREPGRPDGICLVFQPAHGPELQPAEHLRAPIDKPLANRCFATIESLNHAVAERCIALTLQRDTIRNSTLFHWWPRQPART